VPLPHQMGWGALNGVHTRGPTHDEQQWIEERRTSRWALPITTATAFVTPWGVSLTTCAGLPCVRLTPRVEMQRRPFALSIHCTLLCSVGAAAEYAGGSYNVGGLHAGHVLLSCYSNQPILRHPESASHLSCTWASQWQRQSPNSGERSA